MLRARPGDVVSAVDPQGRRLRALVASLEGGEVWLNVEAPVEGTAAFAPGPTLLIAPPKGTRMAWLVEKAVELGAARILPVSTQRGAVKAGGESQTGRWRRLAAAAVKQSGAQPPEIAGMTPLGKALEHAEHPVLAAHPVPQSLPFEKVLAGLPADAVPAFAVGPEGGWTAEEISALEGAGAQFLWLGRRILRAETAAIAMLSAWSLSGRG